MRHSRFYSRAALLIFFAVFVFVLSNEYKLLAPPNPIIIESGPVGGSFHRNALLYAAQLKDWGFDVEIKPNQATLEAVEHVNNKEDVHADIAFTAQSVDIGTYPNVRSLGVIEIQPLFTFIRKESLDKINSPADLKGRKIVLPPKRSVTAATAHSVLKLYGVTEDNTTFTYIPLEEAVKELKEGKHDAGMLMLTVDNKILSQVEDHSDLALLPYVAASAIAGRTPGLSKIEVPIGTFDIQNTRPSQPIPLVGSTVNVIVKKDLHPAVVYALLEIMNDVHRDSNLLAPPEGFPSLANTAIPVHPLATQYSKNGIPWIYLNLPATLAKAIDRYLLIVLAFLFLVESFKIFTWAKEMRDWIYVLVSKQYLKFINFRQNRGKASGRLALEWRTRAENTLQRLGKK